MFFVKLALLLVILQRATGQTYQLHDAVGSGLINASPTCTTMFSENVTCHNTVGLLYTDLFHDFGDNSELTALCKTSCLESLTLHRNRVKRACSEARYYDEYEDTYWLASYPDEFILYAYSIACLKRR